MQQHNNQTHPLQHLQSLSYLSWWKALNRGKFFLQFYVRLVLRWYEHVSKKWNISIHYAVCEHCGSQIKDFRWEDGLKSMPRRDMRHQTQIWRNKKNLEHWWEPGELEKIFIIRHQTRVSFIIQKRVCTCQTADHVCASHYIQQWVLLTVWKRPCRI